jgi:hypothetical protein
VISNVAGNKWHNLKLQFSGSKITGFVDQSRVLTASDSTFVSGMAGLVTGGSKNVRNTALFDNIIIQSPGGTPPKPTVFSKKVNPIYKPVMKK